MALTREQILAMGNVPINTFLLSMGDAGWIEQNLNLPAEQFARDLLARRFTASRTRFRSRVRLAAGCIDIIKKNAYEFSSNELDTNARKGFLARRGRDPLQTLEEFRTLWRGYREEDLDAADASIPQYKIDIQNLLQAAQRATGSLIAKNDTGVGKTRLLQSNRVVLASISTQFAKAFRNNREVRRAKLRFSTQLRRDRDVLSFLGVGDDDFLLFKYRIKLCDPSRIAFPLRHLRWLSAPAFASLQRQWQRNASRDAILEQIAPEVQAPLFDKLLQIYNKIKQFLPVDRSFCIEEMQRAWKADCMLGVALIGITQTEGLIWDFAARLRSTGFRIYKSVNGRNYAYLWDFASGNYKHRHPSGHAKDEWARLGRNARSLPSARKLLETTKLGSFIDQTVFSYLVDEFYDDRNKLAHGNIAARNLRADAVGAILCLRTCLEQLAFYLVSSDRSA